MSIKSFFAKTGDEVKGAFTGNDEGLFTDTSKKYSGYRNAGNTSQGLPTFDLGISFENEPNKPKEKGGAKSLYNNEPIIPGTQMNETTTGENGTPITYFRKTPAGMIMYTNEGVPRDSVNISKIKNDDGTEQTYSQKTPNNNVLYDNKGKEIKTEKDGILFTNNAYSPKTPENEISYVNKVAEIKTPEEEVILETKDYSVKTPENEIIYDNSSYLAKILNNEISFDNNTKKKTAVVNDILYDNVSTDLNKNTELGSQFENPVVADKIVELNTLYTTPEISTTKEVVNDLYDNDIDDVPTPALGDVFKNDGGVKNTLTNEPPIYEQKTVNVSNKKDLGTIFTNTNPVVNNTELGDAYNNDAKEAKLLELGKAFTQANTPVQKSLNNQILYENDIDDEPVAEISPLYPNVPKNTVKQTPISDVYVNKEPKKDDNNLTSVYSNPVKQKVPIDLGKLF